MSKQNPAMPAIDMLFSTGNMLHFTGVGMATVIKGTVVAHKDKMPLGSLNKAIIATALGMCRAKVQAIQMVGASNERAINHIVARERNEGINRISTSMAHFIRMNAARMADEEFKAQAEIVAEVIQSDVCECCGKMESTLQGVIHDIEQNLDAFIDLAKSGGSVKMLKLELSCDDSAVDLVSELMAEIGQAILDPTVRKSITSPELDVAELFKGSKVTKH